jgi:hypothetical protein
MKKLVYIIICFLVCLSCGESNSFENPNFTGEIPSGSEGGADDSSNEVVGSYTAKIDGVTFSASRINVIDNIGYSFNGTSNTGVMAVTLFSDLESGKTYTFDISTGNTGSYISISGGSDLSNSFFSSGSITVEEFDGVEGILKATFNAVLGSGEKITEGVLDFNFPVVNEDDISAEVGDCTTCVEIQTCKGENGNAFVLGVDSNIKYETYLSSFNCNP